MSLYLAQHITFTWADDPAQHEPFMRCRECGADLCTVEEGDTLDVLVSVAGDHSCGDAQDRRATECGHNNERLNAEGSIECLDCGQIV